MALGLSVLMFSEVLSAQTCGFQTTCVPPEDAANGSWQMFYGSRRHTGFQMMRGNLSSGRYVKWTYTTGSYVESSPAIGDINGDGQIEVVVGSGDGRVYALRGTNGTLLWSFTTGSVVSSPAIGDINGDGQIEVVVGSLDYRVYALRGTNGALRWYYTTGGPVYSSPAIGDINGDGQIEVVVGSRDSIVYALRGTNGTLLWAFATGRYVYSSPAIGDINGDGQIEVVVGNGGYGIVYALRGTDGTLLWYYNIGTPYYFMEDVVLVDIDPTPGIEVITHGSHIPTYVLSSSGTLLWSMSPVGSQLSLSVGDVDGDGCVEIVAVGDGIPRVAVIDASSNEGGCGYTDVEEVAKALNPDSYVEVYGVDGKMVYRGKYENFKGKGGVYFVKEGRRVRKEVIVR